MIATPRGLRPHIVLAGPCNGGKSSLLNSLCGGDIALVSEHAGTTTDPVYKNLELLPFGPVTFVDTPGLDDEGSIGSLRTGRSKAALGSGDLVLYVARPSQLAAMGGPNAVRSLLSATSPDGGTGGEIPCLIVLSHSDVVGEASLAREMIRSGKDAPPISVSNRSGAGIEALKNTLVSVLSKYKHEERRLLEALIRPARLVLMIVPIDMEAPAGRLILPQVQAIREVLDADAGTLVVKEREIDWALSLLKKPPDLAICDSQVVLKAAAAVPESIPLTTFSILFSRQKGDLDSFVKAARTIDNLVDGDRVLIAETCSHKSLCDDIGRVKIPRWIRQYTGKNLHIEVAQGPLPQDLSGYRLVIHCGGCMITRRMMLSRMGLAGQNEIPVTNYGIAISYVQGVLERVLRPFARSLR